MSNLSGPVFSSISMQLLRTWHVEIGFDHHLQYREFQTEPKNDGSDQCCINSIIRHFMKLPQQSVKLDQIFVAYQNDLISNQRSVSCCQRKYSLDQQVEIGKKYECFRCFFDIHESVAADAFLRGATVINVEHEELWKVAGAISCDWGSQKYDECYKKVCAAAHLRAIYFYHERGTYLIRHQCAIGCSARYSISCYQVEPTRPQGMLPTFRVPAGQQVGPSPSTATERGSRG